MRCFLIRLQCSPSPSLTASIQFIKKNYQLQNCVAIIVDTVWFKRGFLLCNLFRLRRTGTILMVMVDCSCLICLLLCLWVLPPILLWGICHHTFIYKPSNYIIKEYFFDFFASVLCIFWCFFLPEFTSVIPKMPGQLPQYTPSQYSAGAAHNLHMNWWPFLVSH